MPVAARWIRFDRGRHQLETGTQVLHRARGNRVRRIRGKKPVLAFYRRGGTLETLARKRCRDQAAHRGPADLEALGPCPVGEKLQTARALAERNSQRRCQPCAVEPEHARCRRRGAEDAACRRRMEPALVMVARWQRERDPARHLVAGHDAREHVGARGAVQLARGQCCGNDGCARMQRSRGMRIVKIQRMRDHGVDQRGAGGRIPLGVGEHTGGALGKTHRPRHRQHGRRGLGVMAPAHHVPGQVQDQQARPAHNFRRQRGDADAGTEIGKLRSNFQGVLLCCGFYPEYFAGWFERIAASGAAGQRSGSRCPGKPRGSYRSV